jgi:GAF domain-containing protein
VDASRPSSNPLRDVTHQAIVDVTHQLDLLRQATRRLETEREEATRRERHLRFVRDLAHRSAGRSEFGEFLHFVVNRIHALLDLENCAIFLTATQTMGPRSAVARPPAAPPAFFLADALTMHLLEENAEIRIDDLAAHSTWASTPLRKWHSGALLGLPLGAGEKPFGVLYLARAVPRAPTAQGEPSQGDAFSRQDLNLAYEVASEVALAVDGARRFEEMQHNARQLERSREEIRAYFHQIGAAMSSALNLDQLLRLIVNLCIRVTHADGGSVYLIEGGRLRQRVVVGAQASTGTPYIRESLIGWGQGLPPMTTERMAVQEGEARGGGVKSFLGVPLIIKDEVKGQINIYRHHERDFAPDEVALLTTFAGQAALAIENAQIFRFESQRAREATLLYRAARAIALAADLPEVLKVSATQMLRVTEADRCMIFLSQEGKRRDEYPKEARRTGGFRLAHAAGLSPDQSEFFSVLRVRSHQFSRDIWDTLLRGREVFLSSPPPDSPMLARFFELLPTNSCLLVPLLVKEELLGLLYLDDSNIARSYDASQLRLVMTLAIQIASAIQRARLVGQQTENLEQLKALHQVSTAVAGTLSLPRVLKMVVEKAGELLNNHSCALLVRMDDDRPLKLQEMSNVPDSLADSALQTRISSECSQHKRPTTFYLSGPDRGKGRADEAVVEALRQAGLGGYLAVPLIARRKIVGVLNCFAHEGQHFDLPAIRLMRSFANQAAAALENARLHEIVKNKLHQLGSLFDVGKAITSTLQLDRVLQTVTENVLRVMNADGCGILLLDHATGVLRMQNCLGLGPHHARRTFSLGSGFLGMAAQTGRPMMLVDEGGEGPDGEDVLGPGAFPNAVRRDGMRTILSVPLTVRGRLIGLINIYHKRVHYHEPAEISLLNTLSSQAAIAIENARLYHDKNQVAQLLRSILLPREKFHHPRIEVGHRFISSQELAGDYYEMIPLSERRAAFCMADVSGKGPKAAIYAARAKYILKSYAQAGYSPREVLTMLNRLICPETEFEMFITLFYAEVDLTRGELEFASAGHEPPIVWNARTQKTRLLKPRDLVIGVDRDWQYLQCRTSLRARDLLVLYTDGVTEARPNEDTECFGLGRLQALVVSNPDLAPQALADKITTTVQKYADRKLSDDFSLMVVRLLE